MAKRYRKKRVSTASSKYGMVSTASAAATEAGVQMLERGGNAFDAAVAAAFCLGVTEPQASGIGGQSMALLYRQDGTMTALDGSSRAPYAIVPGGRAGRSVKMGIGATTVPSTPAVLGYILEHYGTLGLDDVLEPAVDAAREGFKLTSLQHTLLVREAKFLQADPLANKIFFHEGKALRAGSVVRQPVLADCLETLARKGWMDFYQGDTAEVILAEMENRKGLITRADLSQIPSPVERAVLESTYRGWDVATFPPPGAGRVLAQILNTLENFSAQELTPGTPECALIMALAFRSALAGRMRNPVDPALYPQQLNKWMMDKGYSETIAARIRKLSTLRGERTFLPPSTSGETTHLSVADSFGNIAAITQSVELIFGAKTMSEGLGFFYNNYLSAFEHCDIMHPYYLLPGGKPWSSVAPTILFKDGHPRFVMGSPGSERIATTLAQVINRLVDGGQDLADAVEAPRLHASSTGRVSLEQDRFHPDVVDTLCHGGLEAARRGAYSFYLGCVQAIALPKALGEEFIGVADPRRDGTAKGPKEGN
jgi:gamma-glutamyltranspeptidase/glutathione hydrolase